VNSITNSSRRGKSVQGEAEYVGDIRHVRNVKRGGEGKTNGDRTGRAGTKRYAKNWIPAFAGMTTEGQE